ncbi:MAG: SIR2 family protein [Psychrosphaera sp.]|nr:SIR2 family protein [Psychrosphaera sp.]
MDTTINKSEHWPALVKILRLAKTNEKAKPVLWVGAGLSVPAGYPSTNALIESINKNAPHSILPFTPDDTTLELDHYQRSFSHWMQQLLEQNTKSYLIDELAAIFLNTPVQPKSTHLSLVTLSWRAIYTTNYDKLLEAALDQTGQSFQVFKHQQNQGLEQAGRLSLYKIHGCVDDIRSWTLDEQSYQAFGTAYKSLQSQVDNLFLNQTIVYVGCSMLDPRIIQSYRMIEQDNKLDLLHPAFVVMLQSEWQAIDPEIKALYLRVKIKPILFEAFADLPELAKALEAAVAADENPVAVDVDSKSDKLRLQREEKTLEEILYGQLAPQIATIIANIWLSASAGQDYCQFVEELLGFKAKRKVITAFDFIVEPLAELCALLPENTAEFNLRKLLFIELTKTLNHSGLDVSLFEKAKSSPDKLQGIIIARDKPRDTLAQISDLEPQFEKALTALCDVLIDSIGALGTWNEENLVAQLENPQHLFIKLIGELSHFKTQLSKAGNIEDETEATFRRAVARRFDELKIFGIDFGHRIRKYQLQVAYISLAMESTNASEVMTTEQALTGFERLVILGEAGQGKTTLLQWLTVECARGLFKEEKAQWNFKVPILIKLREVLKNEYLPQLDDLHLLMMPDTAPSELQQDWLNGVIADKRAIFMIDGFDEVPLDRREATLVWLEGLCNDYNGNHFILTSLPSDYNEGALKSLDFTEVDLKVMDSQAQQDFISHWHKAVAQEEDETRPNALDNIGNDLFNKLEAQPSLRSLAQNPLLCGVICMLHRQRSGYLPQSKSELYKATSEMFLDSRDRERQVIEEQGFNALDYTDKQNFLADIAYWMTSEGLTSIDTAQLLNRLESKRKRMHLLREKITAEQLQRFFLERSGLLLQVGANEIQFAHRSFQEFFTAHQVVSIKHDWQVLNQNATNDFWHGTIMQAIGLSTAPEQNEAFLLDLLTQAESADDENIRTQLYLLVLSCKDGLRELSETLEDQIADILPAIIPPRNAKVRDALTNAGVLALPFLRRPPRTVVKRPIQEDLYCAVALIKMQTAEAYRLLPEYFVDDRASYNAKMIQTVSSISSDLAEQVQLAKLVKAIGPRNIHWNLLKCLAFICQDAELGLISFNMAKEGGFAHYYGRLIGKWEIARGIKPIVNLTELIEIDMSMKGIANVSLIGELTKLESVDLSFNRIENVAPLSGLIQLQRLDLRYCYVEDLSPLASLTQLQRLDLRCNKITDLTALADMCQLEWLSLSYDEMIDFSFLHICVKLGTLVLDGCQQGDIIEIQRLLPKHVDVIKFEF